MVRFSIRDLLWLMIVVGLAAAWWCEHQTVVKTQHERDAVFGALERMQTLLEKDNLNSISDEISKHEHAVGPR